MDWILKAALIDRGTAGREVVTSLLPKPSAKYLVAAVVTGPAEADAASFPEEVGRGHLQAVWAGTARRTTVTSAFNMMVLDSLDSAAGQKLNKVLKGTILLTAGIGSGRWLFLMETSAKPEKIVESTFANPNNFVSTDHPQHGAWSVEPAVAVCDKATLWEQLMTELGPSHLRPDTFAAAVFESAVKGVRA